MYVYARLRTRAHKSAAKLRKKNDIRKSFLDFFVFLVIFLHIPKIFCTFAPKIHQSSSIIYYVYNTNKNACKN